MEPNREAMKEMKVVADVLAWLRVDPAPFEDTFAQLGAKVDTHLAIVSMLLDSEVAAVMSGQAGMTPVIEGTVRRIVAGAR